MARLANPTGIIVKVGGMSAKGKKALGLALENGNSPIYEGDAIGGENILNKGEMNNSSEDDFNSAGVNSPIYEMADAGGNGDGDNNTDPLLSQRYDMQPSSYCVEVATMKMSTNSQKAMRNSQNGDMNTDDTAMATSHNARRSSAASSSINVNTTTKAIDTESDSTGIAPATSHNASRSNRSQGISNDGGDTGSGMDSTQIASATDYNSSRSNTTSSIADLGGDLDGDGFPDMLKNASFSISKRSARTGRSKNPIHEEGANTQTNPMYESEEVASGNSGDLDGDGLGDAAVLNVELAITSDQVLKTFFETGDKPTASQSGPSTDSMVDMPDNALASATYSFSLENTEEDFSSTEARSSDDDPCGPGVWARTTGGNENCSPENSNQENPLAQESGWQESAQLDVAPRDDVHQWTYKINALSEDNDMPSNGTLTVIMTGGKVHFNVHFDPDSDEDGYGELLQNSSFSISKRSARTGRNPQSIRE
mgnify:CR=1 FL=1